MKTRKHSRLLLALICAGQAAACLAGEPIATDRPDFVESSMTVGDGRFQVETSVAWERNDQGGLRDRTFATPTLLRYGISENWELRLESDGWMRETLRGPSTRERASGMADTAIGFKYHIAGSGEDGASMAWLVHADLPSGSRSFGGHGVRPSLRFVAEWELPNDVSFGVMPGIVRDDDGSGRGYTAGMLGIVGGKAWTTRFRTFAEIAASQIASERDGGNVIAFDLGCAYLVNDDLQLDIAGSRGLTKHSPDSALTIGLSRRW